MLPNSFYEIKKSLHKRLNAILVDNSKLTNLASKQSLSIGKSPILETPSIQNQHASDQEQQVSQLVV